jgi:hypothetical protein
VERLLFFSVFLPFCSHLHPFHPSYRSLYLLINLPYNLVTTHHFPSPCSYPSSSHSPLFSFSLFFSRSYTWLCGSAVRPVSSLMAAPTVQVSISAMASKRCSNCQLISQGVLHSLSRSDLGLIKHCSFLLTLSPSGCANNNVMGLKQL